MLVGHIKQLVLERRTAAIQNKDKHYSPLEITKAAPRKKPYRGERDRQDILWRHPPKTERFSTIRRHAWMKQPPLHPQADNGKLDTRRRRSSTGYFRAFIAQPPKRESNNSL
jgi:hypothetical protein